MISSYTYTSQTMIGRQVYFKLSLKDMNELKANGMSYLSPKKYYTIQSCTLYSYQILNDKGETVNILLKPDHCAHLQDMTDWIVKKENPLLSKQSA